MNILFGAKCSKVVKSVRICLEVCSIPVLASQAAGPARGLDFPLSFTVFLQNFLRISLTANAQLIGVLSSYLLHSRLGSFE